MEELGVSEVGEASAWKGKGCLPVAEWEPSGVNFKPYCGVPSSVAQTAKKPLVMKLTKEIIKTYQFCNPEFKYSRTTYQKRFLTSPSHGAENNGYDNENFDLILFVNMELVDPQKNNRYVVKDKLGQGTFGQVVKCWHQESEAFVAVKVIKNRPAYHQQGAVEYYILDMLNQKYDPEDKYHIMRVFNRFIYQNHLCLCFEMLGNNLFEVLAHNHLKGFPITLTRYFSLQMLESLVVMKRAGIIHCDLKPENILIAPRLSAAAIKIIDFGSACYETNTVYSYIQSRYYRSPEVILRYPYNSAIDMWSVGCIIAELYLGLPLFPGSSVFDLLQRMIEILGGQPPDHFLREAKGTNQFFKLAAKLHCLIDKTDCEGVQNAYKFLTEEEYEARESKKPEIGKHYFNHLKLEDIIFSYPLKKSFTKEEAATEVKSRPALVDFLKGLLQFDPEKRWTPAEALLHPFITGKPFTQPYQPTRETSYIPVRRSVAHNPLVSHNPESGHWCSAGLSPLNTNMNVNLQQRSLHRPIVPLSHASSYGSIGSYGSYNDGVVYGSSFGSYGDNHNFPAYYTNAGPPGIRFQTHGGNTYLGASPDGPRMVSQLPHVNGFGASPYAGNIRSMSLGASPSQSTPPSRQVATSAGSPGTYYSSSPARGSFHGSPLGRTTLTANQNRRRPSGYNGTSCIPVQEHFQMQQHPQTDLIVYNQAEGRPHLYLGSSGSMPPSSNHHSRSRMRTVDEPFMVSASSSHPSSLSASTIGIQGAAFGSTDASHYKPDSSVAVPNPGDWDPNYSDDLLLEEDGSDMNTSTTRIAAIHFGSSPGSSSLSGPGCLGHIQVQNPGYSIGNESTTGHLLACGPVDARTPPRGIHGHPPANASIHHLSYANSQPSTSRLGQQYFMPRGNPLQNTTYRGAPSSWNYPAPYSHGRSYASDYRGT